MRKKLVKILKIPHKEPAIFAQCTKQSFKKNSRDLLNPKFFRNAQGLDSVCVRKCVNDTRYVKKLRTFSASPET